MNEQLLILLLPLAAWSGWWLAMRKEYREERLNKNRAAYFNGLNYLLNDQTKQAIKVFMDIVEMDKQTLENQVTLGSLFRKRGELDRALLIHHNLLERDYVNDDVRQKLLFELAEDYYQAGMLADCRKALEELLPLNYQRPVVMEHLLDVYTQEQKWAEAVDLLEQWYASGYGERCVEMAHFYCEMAEADYAGGDLHSARDLLRRAQETDKGCVRANMLLGRLAEDEARPVEAVHAYQSIEQQNPLFLPEVIEDIQRNYNQLGRDGEFLIYLQYLQERYSSSRLALKYAELIAKQYDANKAYDYLLERVSLTPGPLLLQGLLHYGDMNEEMNRLVDSCRVFLKPNLYYRCKQCGFSQQALTWHCPSCKSWSTFYPLSELRFSES